MRVLAIAFAVGLVACASDPAPPVIDPSTGLPFPQKSGQACGGLDHLRCEDGLQCVMNGSMHSDEEGVCMK